MSRAELRYFEGELRGVAFVGFRLQETEKDKKLEETDKNSEKLTNKGDCNACNSFCNAVFQGFLSIFSRFCQFFQDFVKFFPLFVFSRQRLSIFENLCHSPDGF